MSSSVRKIIVFFIFFYALFVALSISNASEEHNSKPEKPDTHLKQTHDTDESGIPHLIAGHIQTVENILTSSPSELKEQAKSYALGKFNSTVSSEVQQWLSQFGTVKINFGLDKKGKLENNSLDLLLPLYDNKTNWLLFSQLGYRNKDSRNTLNLGLGGRYFYQNWMYGLNTFYDHDISGKNRRLGLGGEIWGDYVKFSANGYYRLSHWQNSRNFENYYERPANGYDINGEFYLPFYPNLGAKLSYEQYFGDNVTLFNRDIKQKNPSLAKIGLNYTPIPLITMGVDYKQGESGHTETQFLASLNYKFGTPLSTQLSHDNVAAMRTLAGSRYDLVERNNNIVLDHKKKESFELLVLPPIIGYGHQNITINAPVRSYTNIKTTSWKIADKAFAQYNGKLSADAGQTISITLPSYQETNKGEYTLDIAVTDNQGETKSTQVSIQVLPFLVDGEVHITPPNYTKETDNKENGYTFSDPVITYQGAPNNVFVKNGKIDKVSWTTEPALGDESGLSFSWNNESVQTNENGELIKDGKLMPNILTSKKPHNNVDVYIQLDGATRQKIGSVKFIDYKIKDNRLNVTPDPKKALLADGIQKYTYTAEIIASDGSAVDTVNHVKWSAIGKNAEGNEVKDIDVDGPTGTVKTNNGKLEATLSSKIPLTDVVVKLSIENTYSVSAETVSFVPDPKDYYVEKILIDKNGPLIANGTDTYTYTAYILDQDKLPVPAGQNISGIRWTKNNDTAGLIFEHDADKGKIGPGGTLTATLKSMAHVKDVVVSLAVEGQQTPVGAGKVTFLEDTSAYHIDGNGLTVTPQGPLTVDDGNSYTFSATVVDRQGNKVINQPIDGVKWIAIDDKGKEVTLTSQTKNTNEEGALVATLGSSMPYNNVTVSLAIEKHGAIPIKHPVSIKSEKVAVICEATDKGLIPVLAGESYTCTATVTDAKNQGIAGKKVKWEVEGHPELKPTSEAGQTGSDGKTTATLTSATDVSGLIVTASIEEDIGGNSASIENSISFIWPEIDVDMKASSKGPIVLANGKDKYEVTATIWRKKDENKKYQGKEIEFVWATPQIQNESDTTDVTLIPLPNTPQQVNPNSGTLTADMTSIQWGEVKACIRIAGNNSAPLACSSLVNFALDFEIAKDSVEVYQVNRTGNIEPFDPGKPLLGDDKSEYMYRALIINKNNQQPVPDYLFKDVQWTRNLPEVTDGQLILAGSKKENVKTDGKGYLYTKLKSTVGLNKKMVDVTLDMAGVLPGSKLSQKNKQSVTFDVYPDLAALTVYKYNPVTTAVDRSVHTTFIEQERPYNVFAQLAAEFTSATGNSLVELGDTTKYTPSDLDYTDPVYLNSSGMIIFSSNFRRQKLTLDIMKKNGTQQRYTYEFFSRKYFYTRPDMKESYELNDSHNCEAPPYDVLTPLYSELVSTGKALHDEFPDVYKFGILDGIYILDVNKVYIKMLKSRQNSGNENYLAYDLLMGEEMVGNPKNNVYILCVSG
jgi:adhesin/invasin